MLCQDTSSLLKCLRCKFVLSYSSMEKNFKFILREKLASNYIKSIWTLKCKIMNFNSCGEKTPELQIVTILIKWNWNERYNGGAMKQCDKIYKNINLCLSKHQIFIPISEHRLFIWTTNDCMKTKFYELWSFYLV